MDTPACPVFTASGPEWAFDVKPLISLLPVWWSRKSASVALRKRPVNPANYWRRIGARSYKSLAGLAKNAAGSAWTECSRGIRPGRNGVKENGG
jgi:hypothetical protein